MSCSERCLRGGENPNVTKVVTSPTLFSIRLGQGLSNLTTTASSSGIAIVNHLVTGDVNSKSVRTRVDLAAGWWEIGNLHIEVEKRPRKMGRVLAELLWGVKWVEGRGGA